MIRIAISEDAFATIVATLQFGSIGYETDAGRRFVWLERAWADKLAAMRGPGESCSDVILRLVKIEAALLNPSSTKCAYGR
jgi:hypothetical protein